MPLPFFDYDLEPPAASPGGTAAGSPALVAQQLIGHVFDTAISLDVPAWLSMLAPGNGRTSRTGPSTVETYEANAFRFYSEDGVIFGLLVEPQSTNLITDQTLDAGWTATGTPAVTNAVTPIATTEPVEVTDNDAGTIEKLALSMGTLASQTRSLSAWMFKVDSAGVASRCALEAAVGSLTLSTTAVDAAWTYRDASGTNSGAAAAELRPADVAAANVGACRYWGMQLEQRAYPTSFYDGLRRAEVLRALAHVMAPDGFFSIRLKYRPHYADDEPGLHHSLVVFDDNNKLIFNRATVTFDLVIDGVTLSSAAVTFSRHQEITIDIEHSTNRRMIEVSGASTGNGRVIGDAAAAISSLPTYATILGGGGFDGGAEEGADLLALVPGLRTFCALTDMRALIQMNAEPPPDGSRFRDLLCILSDDPARFFDVCLAIRSAFEVDTAVGVQLDMIGSIVGLPREGFEDDRYRVFLNIQIALLLSAQRDDGSWTGTTENILSIARTFIGDAEPNPIIYTGYPPYSYQLQVPGLVASEAHLLARFLTTANYAAVNGNMIIIISGDSLWASNVGAIPDDAIWESAVTPIAGAAQWQSVVVT